MSDAYLLTWNPNNWDFEGGLNAFVEKIRCDGSVVEEWAVSNGHIQVGDVVYLMKLGVEPRGIVAKGEVIEGVHYSKHYDSEKADQGIMIKKVTVSFTSAVDLNNILNWSILKRNYPDLNWTPQSSGVLIKSEYYEALSGEWSKHAISFSINIPLSPMRITMNDNGMIQYVCGRCSYTFIKSYRCPECGQLVLREDDSISIKEVLPITIHVRDDVSGLKIYEIINKYFGKKYTGWMKASFEINDNYWAWFPTIRTTNTRPNGEYGGNVMWSNTLSSDGKTVISMDHDATIDDLPAEERNSNKRRPDVLIFGRIEGKMRFLGVFDDKLVQENKILTYRHDRIAKGINLSTFELIDED